MDNYEERIKHYIYIYVPCHDSVIIYQNQHVELTLKLCFFHYIYIAIYVNNYNYDNYNNY